MKKDPNFALENIGGLELGTISEENYRKVI